MVKDKNNLGAYAEMFDCARLREIAEMALKGERPDASFSDMECNVWSLFAEIIDRAKR